MNIILEITKEKDKFWIANHPDAKGIKLWYIGLFWTRDCQIESACSWKKKYDELKKETEEKFQHTFYYRVNNAWIKELGPKTHDHFYGTHTIYRSYDFTPEDIKYAEDLTSKVFMDQGNISREDVVFITKEEHEEAIDKSNERICWEKEHGKGIRLC